MDKDEIVVTDRNMRIRDEKFEKEMEERTKARLAHAARVEQARIDRKTWFDKILDWTMGKEKVAKKIAQEKSQEKTIANNKQKTR